MTAEIALYGRAPDLIVPVIGFRQWRLVGGELRSLHSGERWPGDTLSARCRAGRHPEEPAPRNGCSCGVYAWYAPCPRTASAGTADYIAGAVVLWGQIELHHRGMRGQHCRVVALELPLSRWGKRARVLAAAERLGVPAVRHRELRAAAARHGAPVPGQLIPPRPARNGPIGIVPERILAATGGASPPPGTYSSR